MEAMLGLVFLLALAFLGFSIYFFFKILQFVIKAINLYEKMVNRQDTIIKLLQNKQILQEKKKSTDENQ